MTDNKDKTNGNGGVAAAEGEVKTEALEHGMNSETKYWRVFNDEWSQIISGGFNEPEKQNKNNQQCQ